jgi:hypothetical protein
MMGGQVTGIGYPTAEIRIRILSCILYRVSYIFPYIWRIPGLPHPHIALWPHCLIALLPS